MADCTYCKIEMYRDWGMKMYYKLSANTNVRIENFGAIIYNRFGSLAYVDKETVGFVNALCHSPQSMEWLMKNCPDDLKNKLQDFMIWGLKKGYIEIDYTSIDTVKSDEIIAIESSSPANYICERLKTPITATIYPEYIN